MYNNNLAYEIQFEYDNLVQNDQELYLVTDRQRYCPMCDEFHDGSYCKIHDLECGEAV